MTTPPGIGPRIRRRAGWLVLAILLAAVGLLSLARNAGWTDPDDGAVWTDAAAHVVLLEVAPGGPAQAAGLRPGDLLESVDGVAIRSAIEAESILWDGPADADRVYRVVRDGRPVEGHLRPDKLRRPGASLYPYLAIVGFFFLVNGATVALRLPRSSVVTAFLWLSLSMFAVLAVADTPRAAGWDWVLFWVDRAGRLIAPAAFLHFILAFGRRSSSLPRAALAALYAPAAVLGLLNVALVAAGQAVRTADPVRLVGVKDRIELGYMAVCFLVGIVLLVRAYLLRPSRGHRRQLRWLLWGTALGLAPFSIAYLLPTALDVPAPAWAPLTALTLIVLPLAFTSALLRYRLGDLELFLKRGVATLSIAFFTLAVYEILTIVIGGVAGGWFGLPGYAVTGLAVLGAAILYPQIRALTRATVDRIFYRDKYNFRRTLIAFGRELNTELDLDLLVGKIESRVRQTLDLDRIALYLFDQESGGMVLVGRGTCGPARLEADPALLERARAVSHLEVTEPPAGSEAARALAEEGLTSVFPARVKGDVNAMLAVGRRPGGEPLSSEDIQMIVALVAQAASAIEAARLLKQVKEKVLEVERLRSTNENILESSRVGILVIDESGRVLNCNRALETLTGVGRSESLGRNMSELYSLPLVREIEQLTGRRGERERDGASSRAFRTSITNRKGDPVRVNIGISPLGATPETRSGWVVVLDDVTEQVRLEERVLRQDRLAAIGLLASGVAHEVNTPLTGISSYAQMLLERMDPSDPRYELLKKIESQTARASSIANSLLNFSRGGRPSGEGSPGAEEPVESLDPEEIVNEALALFEPQLRGREITLERKFEQGLPRIAGHRGRLQQVLLNLLLNARDAIEGSGKLSVVLRRAGGRLVLEVADDGCGISEENLGRVFDPFFTTKERGRGTGLGLSLSYNIVKEHHGEISVDSSPGRGTTFTIEFPLGGRHAAAGR